MYLPIHLRHYQFSCLVAVKDEEVERKDIPPRSEISVFIVVVEDICIQILDQESNVCQVGYVQDTKQIRLLAKNPVV